MKHNRILALGVLLALALAVPALAAAGSAADPLISRSYAEGTYRAEVNAALDALVDRALSAVDTAHAGGTGLAVVTLRTGDKLTLGTGQQLVLLRGGVRLSVAEGGLINATLGRGSTGGDARPGHRYVAWDDAKIVVTAEGGSGTVAVSPAAAEAAALTPETPELPQSGEMPFVDVLKSDWFYADVAGAHRRGLVNGMDATHYAPRDNMTLAQAVKLAACMHQLYRDGEVTLVNAEGEAPWYYTYVGYALEYDILDEMPLDGWNEPIDRAGFVRIFYRALPEAAYTPINEIRAGAIPDLPNVSTAKEVYAFYAAGILTGYAEGDGRRAHEFGADTAISRAEVATIMNRMFDPAARVRFDI